MMATVKVRHLALPFAAFAVLAAVGCTNSQESSDVQGTTPPVWTGAKPPGGSAAPGHGSPSGNGISTELKDATGKVIGTAEFAQSDKQIQVTVKARGLTPGFHGLHLHQVGKCESNSVPPTGGAPGDFLSAGGHLQTGGNSTHPASGDLPSLKVLKDGSALLQTTTDGFTLEDLKAGRAIIVHAGADNFGNIPPRYTLPGGAAVPDATTLATGDAGGRVACGVIS